MRRGLWTIALVLLGTGMILTASTLLGEPGKKPEVKAPNPIVKDVGTGPLEFLGKTQPAPGHIAIIAPAVLHPVDEVKVTVGTRVKKDQDLIKIDSDEPEADVRAKKSIVVEMESSLARLTEEPRAEEQAESRAYLENARIGTDRKSVV